MRKRRRRADVPLHAVVELGELLLDRRMSGGIEPGQPAQADEALEERHWIDAVRVGRRGCLVGPRDARLAGGVVFMVSAASCACRATRTSAGLQKR